MDTKNLELLRENSTSSQNFGMNGNNHHRLDDGSFAGGNHHHPSAGSFATGNHNHYEANTRVFATVNHGQAEAGFFGAGNHHHHRNFFDHLNGITENYNLPSEIRYSNLPQANNSVHVNPRYPDAFFDIPLESEFARLSLTSPNRPHGFTAAPPAYDSTADDVGNSFTNRNFPSFDYLSHENGGLSIMEMRVRAAALAQLELCIQPHNYPHYNNGGVLDYDRLSMYNHGMNSNGAVLGYGYQPHARGSSLNLNMNNADFQYRSNQIRSNNSVQIPQNNGSIYRRPKFSSLSDFRGMICYVAMDHDGSRFLQNKIEERKPGEIQMIVSEVKDHICDLMVNQNGNYVTQKLFEVCNQEQMNQLLVLVISDDRVFKNICSDEHGTRAVQKLIEHLTTPQQRSLVISVLMRITIAVAKSSNGQHVIQHCLKFFSIEDKKHILNVVVDNCLHLATQKFGCCVLNQCVDHAVGELRERLLTDITSNALLLSEHPFGNYVVQHVLGLKLPHATAVIMAQLSGNYVSMSMNKHGSCVMEFCLKELDKHYIDSMTEEIMYSPNFLRFLQDQYGNYVAQSILGVCKGATYHAMIKLIEANYANLHSHPFGKRVLEKAKGSKPRV